MAISEATIGLPTNLVGLLKEVDPSTIIDDVFTFDSGGKKWQRVFDSGINTYIASWLKTSTAPADLSGRLLIALADPNIKEISLDTTLNINSTVNFNGKVLKTLKGGSITGTGTISNVVIDANYNQQIFSNTLIVLSPKSINGEFFPNWWGAVGDGTTDDTSALSRMNTSLNTGDQATVRVVGGNNYVIDGTVSIALSTKIVFDDNSSIVGNGTFSGGCISASYRQQIFGNSLNVGYFDTLEQNVSVYWFGIKGDGVQDNTTLLQKALDWQIANIYGRVTLYFPMGTYNISSPIIAYKWSGSNYTVCTFKWEGERSTQHGLQTSAIIKGTGLTIGTQFLLGLQLVNQVEINNIIFEGTYIKGQTIGAAGFRNMVNSEYSDWQEVGIRDSQWSPNACVVIDPFWGAVPSDGGYPGLTSWYRGALDSGGSSNFTFNGCLFKNTMVGTVVGLAQTYGQCEYGNFNYCAWENSKVGYAVGNSQANNCNIYSFENAAYLHHFIDNCSYGVGAGSLPNVDKGVIAAGCLMFCAVNSTTKGLMVSDVYCETMYRVGQFSSISGSYLAMSSFVNCRFHLFRYDEIRSADWVVMGKVNFKNCELYLVSSGNNKPYRLKLIASNSDISFEGGMVSQVITKPPAIENTPLGKSSYQSIKHPSFRDTIFYRPAQNISFNKPSPQNQYYDYVSWLYSPTGINKYKWIEVPGVEYTMEFEQPFGDETVFLEGSGSVTVDDMGRASITLSAASVAKLSVDDVLTTDLNAALPWSDVIPALQASVPALQIDQMPILGIVDTINTDTNVVTLRGASRSLPIGVTSSLNIYLNYTRFMKNMFVGDITSASNIITNVDFYVPTNSGAFAPAAAGDRLEYRGLPAGTKVVSVDTGARTITLSTNATETIEDATIIIGQPKISCVSQYSPVQAAALGQPPFFINGMTWKHIGKNGSNEELVSTYIVEISLLSAPVFRFLLSMHFAPN